MEKLSQTRVKRKGQVTIPIELRERFGLQEGTLMKVEVEEGAIILRPSPPLEGGKVVGEERHRQVMGELDRLRREWR